MAYGVARYQEGHNRLFATLWIFFLCTFALASWNFDFFSHMSVAFVTTSLSLCDEALIFLVILETHFFLS